MTFRGNKTAILGAGENNEQSLTRSAVCLFRGGKTKKSEEEKELG